MGRSNSWAIWAEVILWAIEAKVLLWAVAAEDSCHFVGSVGRRTLCEIRPLGRLNSPGERPIGPRSEETLSGE